MLRHLTLAATGLFLLSGVLLAQVESRPDFDEEFRKEIDEGAKTPEDYEQVLWDVGGWVRYTFSTFDDEPFREDRTLRLTDLRLWGQLEVFENIRVYARSRSQWIDWNGQDSYSGDDDEIKPIRLDQGYVDFEPEELLGPGTELKIRAGRQFVQLGRGVVLNNVSDGLVIQGSSDLFAGKILATHSNMSEKDLDQSHPDFNRMRRMFVGAEIDYLGLGMQRIYLLGMAQFDLNKRSRSIPGQDFAYDSYYVGLGGRGTVLPWLSYHVEGLYEFGESAASASEELEDIGAWAATATLYIQPEIALNPLFTLEYFIASGDDDRGIVVSTIGGNTPGTDDEGFLAFGYLQTGYALFPRLSNIHVLKASATVLPLEHLKSEWVRSLQAGIAFYHYRKMEDDGPISDTRAILSDAEIGNEIDLYLRWRPLSDVGTFVNFGFFMPGDAYPDGSDDNRVFLSAGVSYGF